MKRYFALLIAGLVMGLFPARAQGPDDLYVRIYNLIQEADSLNNSGQASQALTKYLQAQKDLQRFQIGYPDWNAQVVKYRLNYLATRIAAAPARVSVAGAAAPNAAGKTTNAPVAGTPKPGAGLSASFALPPRTTASTNVENQLAGLKDQVRQLQADMMLLEAKLKEALAAQPAALDPRELGKAEQKIKTLQKENDLLKVNLAQEKSKPPSAADAKVLEQAKLALTQANRSLAEQTERANTLAQEKKALQTRLDSLIPSVGNSDALETTKKELAQANARLALQMEMASRLVREKEALEARLKSSSADAEAVPALRAENQLLKKQLADLRIPASKKGSADEAERQLAQARTELAALQSDKEILRLEKLALQNRVKQLSAAAPAATPAVTAASTRPPDSLLAMTSTVVPSSSRPQEMVRIKQLEQERDDLLKKLETANKELSARKGKTAGARVGELENQITTLRARLEVFETRQVPYSAEELALFKQPETRLAKAKAGKRSIKELPAGSAALVAEAQRYFSARQLDKAEERYLQVLRQDDKNVITLANLAAIQLELNRLDQAEKHINEAVALDPEDAYSLSVLGHLKFRQEKYDDALDALSRASKLDPQNPEIWNYLGITLAQKGMRRPAEAAFRQAIQLEPGYGDAHLNLAVVYVRQQPPWVELARWHYQKALAAGHPHDAELEKMFETRKTADRGQ